MKTCSHANFRSKTATVIELRFFMKKKMKKMKNYLYFIPGVIFSFSFQLLFLHVLHLDVLRRQIEIETERDN